jgi:hypothetical protein
MLIEVIAGRSEVKEIRRQSDQSVMAVKQEAYISMEGSAFPVRCMVTVEKPLQPGKYNAEFPHKIGKWGDIEINPFQPAKFTPARPEQIKAAG